MIALDVSGVALENVFREILRNVLPAENCSIFSDADDIQARRYVGFLVRAEAPDTDIKYEDGTPAVATYPVTLTYVNDTREATQYVFSALASAGGVLSKPSIMKALERVPEPFNRLFVLDVDTSNGAVTETASKRFDFTVQFNFKCFPLMAEQTEE